MTSTTKTTTTRECDRCCGMGRLSHFRHVEGGVCFACNGSGRLVGKVRPTVVREGKVEVVLTSDRYPGWKITKNGGESFNMSKGGHYIIVTRTNGKDWTGYVVEQDMTGIFTGTVADAVAYCGG